MRPESSSHLPGKESPLFVIKIFRFQLPGLCPHHSSTSNTHSLSTEQKATSPKTAKPQNLQEPPLACRQQWFPAPTSPLCPRAAFRPPPLGLSLSCFCFQVLITLECYPPSLCLFPNPQDRALRGQATSPSHQHHPAQGLDSRELRK